jgi:hypothetical protein
MPLQSAGALIKPTLDAVIVCSRAYLMIPRMRLDTFALVYGSSWCDPSFKPQAILRFIGVFAGLVLGCGVEASV